MQAWMIVQIFISAGLILVVIFQPRKAGMGGGIFKGMTRAKRSNKFKNLPVLGKLTIVFAVAFMVVSLIFAFLLT